MTNSQNTPGEAPLLALSPSLSPRLNLVLDSLYISAENIDQILQETRDYVEPMHGDSQLIESNAPNAFITGLSYTSSWGNGPELALGALENIPVGIQEHAIAPGSIALVASTEGISNDLFMESPVATEAIATAKRIQKQSAKQVAYDAAAKRVSRRLLLAERSKKLTVTCPTTGIVSLIEIPAIPFPQNNPRLAKAMVWTSPFADLNNCRGIAQQGVDYLKRLDTQVLAGVLIVLADTYSLFRFQPFDTGAQKNAILRTAGKHYLIDAIIMIETLIHSANCSYLPKLSLAMDQNLSEFGLEVRMQAYLKLLADAIAKPDKDVWDEKKVKPQYPIRPVYVKDVIAGEKKLSFLARQEQQRAKKEFSEDKKAGKIAATLLAKAFPLTSKLKLLLDGLMSDEGMLVMPSMIIDAVCMKLETFQNPNAEILIKIIRKDRKALILDLEELETSMSESIENPEEPEEQDDPTPGNEEETEDSEEETEAVEAEGNSSTEASTIDEQVEASQSEQQQESTELTAPAGLNAWEQLMWKKKMLAAQQKQRTFLKSEVEGTASYTPSVAKTNLGRE